MGGKNWRAEYKNDKTGEITTKTIRSITPISQEEARDIAENEADYINPTACFTITISQHIN